jgi:rhomboid family GlyGly-CTERM serine protease
VSARAQCEAGGAGLCPAPPWLVMLLAAVAGGVSLLPDAGAGLAYQRDLIAAGELWRLFTGHFVHWSHSHLVWDLCTFLALGAACELRSRKRLLACLLASAVAIPGAVWLLLPELELYAGLSGIDSALFALLGGELVHEQWKRGNAAALAIALVFCLAFVLKTGFEMTNGGTVFVGDLAPGIVSVPLAHLTGAVVGLTASALRISAGGVHSRVSPEGSCAARPGRG